MSFKSGVKEASKKDEEKMKISTQGFSGFFSGSFLVGWLVFLCVGVVGFHCFLQFVGHFVCILFFHSVVFTKNPNCQKKNH